MTLSRRTLSVLDMARSLRHKSGRGAGVGGVRGQPRHQGTWPLAGGCGAVPRRCASRTTTHDAPRRQAPVGRALLLGTAAGRSDAREGGGGGGGGGHRQGGMGVCREQSAPGAPCAARGVHAPRTYILTSARSAHSHSSRHSRPVSDGLATFTFKQSTLGSYTAVRCAAAVCVCGVRPSTPTPRATPTPEE